MEQRDPYELLQVGREVDEAELKRVYRVLAKRYHPDLNSDPGAEDMFKEVGYAYRVLSTPRLRELYDRFGHAGLQDGFDASSAAPSAGAWRGAWGKPAQGGGARPRGRRLGARRGVCGASRARRGVGARGRRASQGGVRQREGAGQREGVGQRVGAGQRGGVRQRVGAGQRFLRRRGVSRCVAGRGCLGETWGERPRRRQRQRESVRRRVQRASVRWARSWRS